MVVACEQQNFGSVKFSNFELGVPAAAGERQLTCAFCAVVI